MVGLMRALSHATPEQQVYIAITVIVLIVLATAWDMYKHRHDTD